MQLSKLCISVLYLLSKEQEVQVSDARDDDQGTEAGIKKNLIPIILPVENKHQQSGNISPEMISGEIHRIANNYVKYADWFREKL